jgi:hypothetical protein
VKNEPGVSNLRGTVAMAKIEDQPHSATKEWFVNLVDNSANLDDQNGGFTVFAVVESGLAVVDALAALPRLGLEARLQRTPFREAFLDAPLLSTPPGPSGADCFDPVQHALGPFSRTTGALLNLAGTGWIVDPVMNGPFLVSPACVGVTASGSCTGPNRVVATWDLETEAASTPLTEMTCDELEASNLSLALRRARVRERLVGIERAFLVPEPGAGPSGAAALLAVALAARRLRNRA